MAGSWSLVAIFTALHCPRTTCPSDTSAIMSTIHTNGTNGLLAPKSERPGIRRLSSATAQFDDLALGPSIIVPPDQMDMPGDAHENAAAMEMAKHRLNKITSSDSTLSTPGTPPETCVTDIYAFAFGIDGVLIRGGKPISEAIEAMKVLNGKNELGLKM